ncbi:MAG: NAD(P)H-dependent oxidoreductase [Pirellulaceae bacterium]|nr:NAD(P)H-dependent oxidoreductase [Planctomycetales bacterium]
MYLVLSCSLNPKSRSRVMAQEILQCFHEMAQPATLVDLQVYPLPFCDAGGCYGGPGVAELGQQIREAAGVIIATPIYNYDVNAAAKNVIELTGKAWTDKVVGFLCAAGGGVSYMAPMGVASSLMLDFRSVIVPRFVFATGKSFDDDNRLADDDVRGRITELATTLHRFSSALNAGAGDDGRK